MLAVDKPQAIDTTSNPHFEKVAAYLKANIAELGDMLSFYQFRGGYSNLTYLVSDGVREYVLKSAPPGIKAKGAHDMAREFRFMSRLNGIYPYAPRCILMCDDATVFGESFCVMEKIEGVVVRTYPNDGSIAAEVPGQQFSRLVEAMAELHAIDCEKFRLFNLGRPEGYRQRQLERWIKRLDAAKTRDMAAFEDVVTWLSSYRHEAEGDATSVVHNDFKLDNLIWSTANITKLIGVLDWEMATLGHPLVELGITLSFWPETGDPNEFVNLRAMPSARPGVMSRNEAVALYAQLSGIAPLDMDYYLCFGLFRRAVIEQQKYVRFIRGESTDKRFSALNLAVTTLHNMCIEAMDRKFL